MFNSESQEVFVTQKNLNKNYKPLIKSHVYIKHATSHTESPGFKDSWSSQSPITITPLGSDPVINWCQYEKDT